MIFIKLKDNTNNEVAFVHYMPFDENCGLGKSAEELQQIGILADSIQVPFPDTSTTTKLPILKYDGTNLFYDYIDSPIPSTNETKIAELESTILEMSTYMGTQDQKLAEQEQTIMELTTLLAGGTTNV
ncbi:hypothetical protein [Kurthia gibsonii]|uniref:hypothetical protein n=1 Tax=Kurthia gibsonii TaxID=33946 RepID=UPI0031B69D35